MDYILSFFPLIHTFRLTGERVFTYTVVMSKRETFHLIEEEIDRINEEIDRKIIRGLSYYKESRRHKKLLRDLRRLSEEISVFQLPFRLSSRFLNFF